MERKGWIWGGGAVGGALCLEIGGAAVLPVLGLCFVYLAWRRPLAAVLAAYAAILLDSWGMSALRVAGLPLTLAKGAVAFALAIHLGRQLATRRALFVLTPISAGVMAVLASMWVSVASVRNLRLAWIELAGVTMLAVLLHLVASVVTREQLVVTVRWMAAMTLVVFGRVLVSGAQHGVYGGAHEAWHTRSSGAMTDPNAWATGVLVSGFFLMGALSRDDHRLATPLLVGLLVLTPACLMQSMSRAGLHAACIAAPVLLWALRPRWRLVGLALAPTAVAVVAFVNVEAVLLRYATLVDPTIEAGIGGWSLRERESLVNAAVTVIQAHPFVGVGVGNFRVVAEELTSGAVFKIAHNSYLTILAEQGLLGAISHGWLAGSVLVAAGRAALGNGGTYREGVGRGFLASAVAFGAMAATLNLATFALAWFVFAVGLVATPRAGEADTLPAYGGRHGDGPSGAGGWDRADLPGVLRDPEQPQHVLWRAHQRDLRLRDHVPEDLRG